MHTTIFIKGSELKPNDLLHVWWSNKQQQASNRARIRHIKPYTGPLLYLFDEGASIAEFYDTKCGMTIEHSTLYYVDRESE
jgi:hypothetical protein